MLNKINRFSGYCSGLWFLVTSLTTSYAQVDKSDQLTYEDFINNVLLYHPVASRADLKLRMAEAEWLASKGNFDPVLTAGWNQKNFDDKLYYRNFQSKLQVPVAWGIDVVGGYENTDGVFLNPENKTDQFGLWNIGIEANLLQGFRINERTTAVKQARIFQDLAQNQQQIMLNELLFAASLAYLDWQQYFYLLKVVAENRDLAITYYENTRESFFGGEKTGMDTLEAFILSQDATTLLQRYQNNLVKAQQQLENFLWYKNLPLELQEPTTPQLYLNPIFNLESPFVDTIGNHPILLEKLNKQALYQTEQRLKREKLKPKLKVKYNPLLATTENSLTPSLNSSDFKWGFDFSLPLFLRSERAGIQMGEIKLQEVALEIQDKRNELRNKIESALQEQVIIREQLQLQRQNVAGYRTLLENENELFRLGESSVFLLNKRQEKYIDGQIKLVALYIKLEVVLLKYHFYNNSINR